MATDRKTKTNIKRESEPKHVKDSKSSGKVAPSPRGNGKNTPDPGPMKEK